MNKRLLLLMILILVGSSGCGEKEQPSQLNQPSQEEVINKPVLSLEEEIENYIDTMSLQEKLGQLLMPAFRSYDYEGPVDVLSEEMAHIIDSYKIGGVILFKENIKNPKQTKDLIKALQNHSGIPLWIGVDEEGGLVSRIGANPDMGFTPIAEAFEIGKTGDIKQAADMGQGLGKMLRELEFNMNFAPVLDIWSNPNNTVIGKRSFGEEANLVSQMAIPVMKALQKENIVSVIKHFPGHGDTQEDTHQERAFVDRSLDQLLQRELMPFKEAIASGADAVMVAHIELPQIHEGIPASLSSQVITDLLKNQLGFEGLVITDALDMGAITDQFSKGQLALESFLAGTDILLMPDIIEANKALLEAYEEGRLTDRRINKSVKKILYTKYKYKIISEDFMK